MPNTPQQFPEDLRAVPPGDQSSWANWAFMPLFFKTKRSIVSVHTPRAIHHFEPASTSRGITLGKTRCTPAGLALPITLGFRGCFITPLREHLIEYHAADNSCSRSFATKPPSVPPSSCLNASQGRTTAEHHTRSPCSLQQRQCVTLLSENIPVPSVKCWFSGLGGLLFAIYKQTGLLSLYSNIAEVLNRFSIPDKPVVSGKNNITNRIVTLPSQH